MAYDLQITNVTKYECPVRIAMTTGTIVDAFTVEIETVVSIQGFWLALYDVTFTKVTDDTVTQKIYKYDPTNCLYLPPKHPYLATTSSR